VIDFWRPMVQDMKQYWQVDLGQKIAVYAVKMLGDKTSQQIVTSYEILHSVNGVAFSKAIDINGATKVLLA
jgi:F5/8 type C domain